MSPSHVRAHGRHVLFVIGAVLAMALAACGTDGQVTEPGTAPATETDAGSPDQAEGPSGSQELTVGAGEDGYDQEGPEANVGMYPTNANVFETLVRMTPDYELEPMLAESWEFVEPNTWRFQLRTDVTFHDGSPLTAQDVVHTMSRVAEAGGGTLRIDEDSTVAVDEHTVEITPTVENRRLVEQLVHPEHSIIKDGTAVADEQTGTGPFQMVEYAQQEHVIVERFEDYWGEAPALERITFRFLPDPNARRLALEAGDVDLVLEIPGEMAGPVEQTGAVLAETPVGAYEAAYLNISEDTAHPALLEADVRRAIEHAIDRQSLVDSVFEGFAEAEQTMIPSRLLGDAASEIDGHSYDPDQAAQLLDDAGWTEGDDGVRQKDGQRLGLTLVTGFPNAQVHATVPEFLQGQLAEVGIDVEIVTTPDRAGYEDRLQTGDGDIWLEQGSQNDANPAFLPALLFWEEGIFGHTSYQPLFAPGWPEGEDERAGDGTFDRLIEEALATPDHEEVQAKTAQAMSLMIDEHAIVVPLAGMIDVHAHSPRVNGFEPHPSTIHTRWDSVFLTEG